MFLLLQNLHVEVGHAAVGGHCLHVSRVSQGGVVGLGQVLWVSPHASGAAINQSSIKEYINQSITKDLHNYVQVNVQGYSMH